MARKNHPARLPPFDELAAAEVFLRVVRCNGFTPAAKLLGKSTSSISRAVTELERQLGAQLLTRTTRRIHLTEAGALYAGHAEGLLAAQRSARDAVAELTGGVARGHLRVTMPVTVGERSLAPHLPAFRKSHPELRLELDLSDRNIPVVEAGFDLAIRVGRLADSALRAQLLAKVPVKLVASPRYLAARGTPAHPDELAAHTTISIGGRAGNHEWTFHRRGGRPRRVAIDAAIHTTSPTLATQLATSGVGITRVVSWVIRDELHRGHLVEVMPEWSCDAPSHGGVPVYVVYAQTASATPPLKSRVFVDFVKSVMAREDFS